MPSKNKGDYPMIREHNLTFELSTPNTTYAFRVTETGPLEHLYYGSKITLSNYEYPENFDIKTIKILSNNGFGYKDIINNFYHNSKIIK